MADILRFDPLGPPSNPNWRRFPRFDEVGAQIDAQANRIFDTRASLDRGSMLYARVEQKLRGRGPRVAAGSLRGHHPASRACEHAAYLVGLRAGAGRLPGLAPVLDDDRTSPDDPKRAWTSGVQPSTSSARLTSSARASAGSQSETFSPRSNLSSRKKTSVDCGTPGMNVARARRPSGCLSRHKIAGSE